MRNCVVCGLCLATPAGILAGPPRPVPRRRPPQPADAGKEALYWESAGDGKVKCTLCPNFCVRGEGETTHCKTRIAKNGRLYTLTYGKPCLLLNDEPLTKNPLYHVDPGASAIGAATAGCNLSCSYCQNWEFSQVGPDRTRNMDLAPDELVRKAKERNIKWLTFSYTEPVAYFEYLIDAAKAAKKSGMRVAVATAGSICAVPLQELVKHVNAFSVTLKGYTQQFYREVCGCNMEDVHNTIKAVAKSGVWMEIATLIVPGLNDEQQGLQSIAKFIAGINRKIPLHFLRFAPAYKLKNLQPTPIQTLEKAHAAARKEGLEYVYLDLSGHQASATYCPKCNQALLERSGFGVVNNRLRSGKCSRCNYPIPGLF